MTQPVTEKKRPPLKWIVPIPTNEGGSFGRPSLCAACRGNDVMAVILNYFVYEASTEAEQKKIDTLKVQSIQLKRTHDEILKGIHPSRISKKTLIDHMHKLETWGFLKVDGYHHIYEVFFPAITEAMKTPPPAEKRKPRGRHVSQKVKSTNLQSSEVKSTNHAVKTTNSEDCTLEQISNLQSEMLNLQSEMSKLQFQMLNLTFRQSSEAASQQMLTPLSEAPRLIDCNRLIETSNYVAANAGNDTPSFSFPILDASSEAVTDETFKVAVMDDWREYKHLPRITPTIDVMSEVLKHLQRASVTPDFSTQANAVENPGQLADSSTVSDIPASSDAVTLETPLPSQANNDMGKNSLSQKTLSDASTDGRISQTEVTTQNEVVQASNGQSPIAAVATRNLDDDEVQTPPESGKGKRTRTPEDETIKARVERVFAYFDTLKQETTGKPEERYARTKAAAKEIKDTLLPCGPTELKLRKVYLKLWNTPPSKGSNFHWKDHMTIKAVCGQYESVMLAVDADEKVEAEKKRAKQALESIVKSPPILVQAEDDYVFDLERVRGNRGRRSAS